MHLKQRGERGDPLKITSYQYRTFLREREREKEREKEREERFFMSVQLAGKRNLFSPF